MFQNHSSTIQSVLHVSQWRLLNLIQLRHLECQLWATHCFRSHTWLRTPLVLAVYGQIIYCQKCFGTVQMYQHLPTSFPNKLFVFRSRSLRFVLLCLCCIHSYFIIRSLNINCNMFDWIPVCFSYALFDMICHRTYCTTGISGVW